MVELREVGEDGEPVRPPDDVLHVEECGDAQLLLGHLEGEAAVAHPVPRLQLGKVDQVGSVAVDERAEGPTIPPGPGHVGHTDAGVVGDASTTPFFQGCDPVRTIAHLCL